MNSAPNPYQPASLDSDRITTPRSRRLTLPIVDTAIVVALLGFIFGVVVPFSYASRKTASNPAPLPSYLSWVDALETSSFVAIGILAPIFVLAGGAFVRFVAPPSFLPFVPWWRTSIRDVVRRHRRRKPHG